MISKKRNSPFLDFKKTFIQLDQKVKDALKSLNYSRSKLCIVVDKKNSFKGVLNDGDIRRALLKGYKTNSTIKSITVSLIILLYFAFKNTNSFSNVFSLISDNNLSEIFCE